MAVRCRGTLTLLPAAAALAVTVIASCRDTTRPRLGVTVRMSSIAGPFYYADSTGRQFVQCDATLQAHNAGTGPAVWMQATFAFYASGDSTTAIALNTIPATTIGSSWGADSIGPDATQAAHWRLKASVPFELKMRFYFQMARGLLDSSEVLVACGPSTASGPPPTITSLQSQPDTALEPGGTLQLSYGATSSLGLWQSVIHVTGPCDTTLLFPEQAQRAVGHNVALVMPARCNLGVPIRVTAASVDVRFQQTSQSLALPALVDHTRPVVSVILRTPFAAWAPAASFAGYLFSGEALEFFATASDNHALHGIYWEIAPAGFRESIFVSGPAVTQPIGLPAQAGWAGRVQARLYVTDESGNVSDTIASAAGAIEVFPTVGPFPTPTVVPEGVTDLAFDAKRGVIYLLRSDWYQIVVLSQASLTVLRTIALTDYAPTIDLSPSGDSLITVLMNSHALGVVDLTQASPALQAVPLAGLDSTYRLLDVRVAATGQALLAAQHQVLGGVTRLYTYALANGTLRLRSDAPALGYNFSGMLGRSADGTVIVVNGAAGAFLRYDARTDTFGPAQTARTQTSRPSLDATGAHIAVAGGLYDVTLQYQFTVRAALSLAGSTAISPDGQTHYLAIAPTYDQLGLVRSRASDGSIIDHIPVPMMVTVLRVSPDGSTLAVIGIDSGFTKIGLVTLGQLH